MNWEILATSIDKHDQAPSLSDEESSRRAKPRLIVSDSGRLEDQFYHTRAGSHFAAVLKNRAYRGRSGRSATHTSNEEVFTDSEISHTGYLRKEGSYWKTWKKRYFILRNDRHVLAYYCSIDNLTKLGEVQITPATQILHQPVEGMEWRFCIHNGNRRLVLDAQNQKCMDGWMEAFGKCQSLIRDDESTALNTMPTPFRSSSFSDRLQQKNFGPSKKAWNSMLDEVNEELEQPTIERKLSGLSSSSSPSFHGLVKRHSDPNLASFGTQFKSCALEKHSSVSSATMQELMLTCSQPFSLTAMRPTVSLQVSLSFGVLDNLTESANIGNIFVVVFDMGTSTTGHHRKSRTKEGENDNMLEIGRTEIQGGTSGTTLRCLNGYIIQDFTTLIKIPFVDGQKTLQFQVFAFRNGMTTEQLHVHQSLGAIRVSTREIVFAPKGNIIFSLSDRPGAASQTQNNATPGSPRNAMTETCASSILIVETFKCPEIMELAENFTYASQSYLVDVAPSPASPSLSSPVDESPPSPLATEALPRDSEASPSHLLLTEELSASYLSINIPCIYLDYLNQRNQMHLRSAQSKFDELSRENKRSAVATNDEKLLHIKYAIDHYDNMIHEYQEKKMHYDSLFSVIASGLEPGISCSLKRSVLKKNKEQCFTPLNLSCHLLRISRLDKTRKLKTKGQHPDLDIQFTITHGAACDHVGGFKDGGLRRLYALPNKSVALSDQIAWQRIQMREDVVRSQILSIAATSFLSIVNLAKQNSAQHIDQLKVASEIGFFMSVESLLSTVGHEKGMLEDLDIALKWLNYVQFQFIQLIDPAGLSRCVSITPTTSPREKPAAASNSTPSIAEYAAKQAHEAAIIVTFALREDEFSILPSRLQEGNLMQIIAVLFTQGINEKQSVANLVMDTTMQDDINQEHFTTLVQYFEKYRRYCIEANLLSFSTFDELAQLVQNLKSSLKDLQHHHQQQQEQQPQRRRSHLQQRKQVNVLIHSSDLCRRLGAGRTICCKSGKDRTAMSVTLEMSRLVVHEHQVKHGIHLCNTMRLRGVRRTNVLINTGKNRYAFNSFQLKCLPDSYRPPALAADSSVKS